MRYVDKRAGYERLPLPVQRLICRLIPFPLLAGSHYRAAAQRGRLLYHAEATVIRRWQERPLRDILLFATAEVPAYRHLATAAALLPPFEALARFPLVTKEEIQDNPQHFVPASLARIPHHEVTTGGSTGRQARFLHDDGSQEAETGYIHRLWHRVGYRPGMRKVTFRGVPFPQGVKGVYWRENPIYTELQFSPYHMNHDTLPLYWQALQAYRPLFIHGYPSCIAMLARWLRETKQTGTHLGLRAVLLGSEGLEPGQRELMQQTLGARVFTWYGHTERVILAGECERSEAYHVMPDYGIVEILDPASGTPVDVGREGELVGTGLSNRSMPLIRYRTGDLARRLSPECICGRHGERFDHVTGRWVQEYLIGKGGARIPLAAVNVHGPCFARVERHQYHQTVPGMVTLRIKPSPTYGCADSELLLETFRSKVGGALDIKLDVVPDIPLSPRGKLIRLVQEIDSSAS